MGEPLQAPTTKHRDPRRRAALVASYYEILRAADPAIVSHPTDVERMAYGALCRAVADLILYHDSSDPARRVLAGDALWCILEARYDVPERGTELLETLGVENPALIARELVRLFQWSIAAPEAHAGDLMKRWAAESEQRSKAAYDKARYSRKNAASLESDSTEAESPFTSD